MFLDGTGYVEDGREIFDDEEVDVYEATNTKESGRGQKRKAKLAAQPNSKGNIRTLLGSMPTKKKEVCMHVVIYHRKKTFCFLGKCIYAYPSIGELRGSDGTHSALVTRNTH